MQGDGGEGGEVGGVKEFVTGVYDVAIHGDCIFAGSKKVLISPDGSMGYNRPTRLCAISLEHYH